MLVSQRTALDPKFLHFNPNDSLITQAGTRSVSAFRKQVMMATKVIVPVEIMHLKMDYMNRMNLIYGLGWDQETIKKKNDQYLDFARLPFDSILLENHTGALFVRKETAKHPSHDIHCPIVVSHITNSGYISESHIGMVLDTGGVSPNYSLCTLISHGVRDELTQRAFDQIVKDKIPFKTEADLIEMIEELRDAFQNMTASTVLEVLLFMNVRNIEQTIYKMSHRERQGFQKSVLPFYEYRILDIYKTRKEYKSLTTVGEGAGTSGREAVERRAHLVRGHFKKKKDKLYWWNPFMRNRKNITTHGIVEKDYQLVDS